MNYKIKRKKNYQDLWIEVTDVYSQVFKFDFKWDAEKAMHEAIQEDKKWPVTNWASPIADYQARLEA